MQSNWQTGFAQRHPTRFKDTACVLKSMSCSQLALLQFDVLTVLGGRLRCTRSVQHLLPGLEGQVADDALGRASGGSGEGRRLRLRTNEKHSRGPRAFRCMGCSGQSLNLLQCKWLVSTFRLEDPSRSCLKEESFRSEHWLVQHFLVDLCTAFQVSQSCLQRQSMHGVGTAAVSAQNCRSEINCQGLKLDAFWVERASSQICRQLPILFPNALSL